MLSESYALAIDIGTSRTAAATARIDTDGAIVVSSCALGAHDDTVASAAFVAPDEALLFGDTAVSRGLAQPERVIREFTRRVGDDVPISVGGASITPAEFFARMFASVLDVVVARQGSRPDAVMLTVPTSWGPHRRGEVITALGALGIDPPAVMPEPESAARRYDGDGTMPPGHAVAVFDLGAAFDVAVLRKEPDGGFVVLGEPGHLDSVGGADFDDAVLRHVLATAEVDTGALDLDDPTTLLALAQQRQHCVEAKEALSFESDAAVPVVVASGRRSVRLTRTEFDHMVSPVLESTVDALEAAIASADAPPDLDAILLVGGSARIPLVAQRLSERFDLPILLDADPSAATALGAARTALVGLNDRRLALVASASVDAATAADLAPAVVAPPPSARPAPAASRRGSSLLIAAAALLIAGAIVFGSTLTAGSGSNGLFTDGLPDRTGAEPAARADDTESATKTIDTPASDLADTPPSDADDDAPGPRVGPHIPNGAAPKKRPDPDAVSTPAPGIRGQTAPSGRTDAAATTPPPSATSDPTNVSSTAADETNVPAPTASEPSPAPDPAPTTPAPEPEEPAPATPEPEPGPGPGTPPDPEPAPPAPDPAVPAPEPTDLPAAIPTDPPVPT